MRLFVLIAAAALIAGSATAQAWKVFNIQDAGVTVEFPAAPTELTGIYKSPLVPNAPTHVLQYRDGNAILTLVVVDLQDRSQEGASLLEEAAYNLTFTGSDMRMDTPVRVYSGTGGNIFGRTLTVDLKHGPTPEADGVTYPTKNGLDWLHDAAKVDLPMGSSSTASVFFAHGRLYIAHGVNLPAAGARAASASRFAQSLNLSFPDDRQPAGGGAR